MSAVFSPDGQHVLTASRDRTAKVWSAASGGGEGAAHLEGSRSLHSVEEVLFLAEKR